MPIRKISINRGKERRSIGQIEFFVTLILYQGLLAIAIMYIVLRCIAVDPHGWASQHLICFYEIPIPTALALLASISFISWIPLWIVIRYLSWKNSIGRREAARTSKESSAAKRPAT